MNKLILLFCAVASAALAADVTGRWVAEMRGPDGQARQQVLALKADGAKLSGHMTAGPQGEAAISEGKIAGDEISFVMVREFFGEDRKMQYTGKVNGETLTLQMPGMGDRPGRQMAFKRVSTEAPKPLPPPVPKISLPAPKPVAANGLAKTPPMGWNSWNKFRREVSDKLVREVADAMAKNGMRDAGYIYVNIDDCWQGTRDEKGNIRANERFPDMKALADYIHSKGLKLGIYSSPGPKTCAGYEGSYQHEEQDARTYAAWGVDYLKYDWCSARNVFEESSMPAVYAKMGQALLDAGRPMVYSLCQYGRYNVGEWGAKVGGNLWRTTGDIRDTWASMERIGFEQQLGREKFAGPGRWNDPDMLEIGNGGMSEIEYRTHMTLWSLLAAPLLAGNDLRDVPPAILEILTNREVIAVDQDALGKQAVRVSKEGDVEVWARPLADGSHAVGLFNRGKEPAKVTARWIDAGVQGRLKVRDLWAHADKGTAEGSYSAELPPHGCALIKLTKAR